jgi:hypothetical protein
MKKLFLTLTVLLLTLTLSAQEAVVYEMTSYRLFTYNETTETWKASEWENCDGVIIRVDLENNIVRFDNKGKTAVKVTDYLGKSTGKDPEDNDPYEAHRFSGVDKNGIRCKLRIVSYNSGVEQVGVEYADVAYIYQGKKVEF